MNDSTTGTSASKITITETFNIAQAVGELSDLARQTALITRQIEQLLVFKDKVEQNAGDAYDLTYLSTANLERMADIAAQLNELMLVEYSPAAELPLTPPPAPTQSDKLSDILGHSHTITALAKSLTQWLMYLKPLPDTGQIDLNTGDGLELASMIVAESQKINELSDGVQP